MATTQRQNITQYCNYQIIQLLAAVGVLLVYDFFFFIIEGRVWLQTDEGNTVWNRLYGLHLFSLFCSVIGFILKIGLFYFVFQAKRNESRPLM